MFAKGDPSGAFVDTATKVDMAIKLTAATVMKMVKVKKSRYRPGVAQRVPGS
jgi:hypothetical protein